MRVPVAAVLLMLLPCMLHGADAAAVRWHKKPLFPAIFSFGDSYADTGNYAVLEGDRPFNYSPYGETIGRPTGRASDGLLVIDYVGTFCRRCHRRRFDINVLLHRRRRSSDLPDESVR